MTPPTLADRRPTLTTVNTVQLLVSLDLCIVNVALPDIAAGLGFSANGLAWVVHAYVLTFGGLLLLGGRLADVLGRRRMLITGLAVFAFASLLGGLAATPGQLVAARALQGVGAAVMQPASLAVLTVTFPAGPARARAFGIWSAINALGAALGVVLGGVLTELGGWRWVMLLNVPVAAVPLLLARRALPYDGAVRRSQRPDVAGGVLATSGATLLVLGLVRSADAGWTAAASVVPLVLGVALLWLFVLVERAAAEPLLRLGLFSNRSVVGSNVFNLLLGAAMAACFYFLSLYVQQVLGHPPALAGVMFLPFALGVIVGAGLAIRLGQRWEPRALMVLGAPVTAVGFAWLGAMSADGSFVGDVLGPSLIASVGFGLCLGPVVSTATQGVADHESGMASGVLASARQLGASLGLAILGTAAAQRIAGSADPVDLSAGYGLALTLGAGLLLVGAAVVLLVLPMSPPGSPRVSATAGPGAAPETGDAVVAHPRAAVGSAAARRRVRHGGRGRG